MSIEKELLLNYGYIREQFGKLFDLINRYDFISASLGLSECFNIKKQFAIRMMKQWIKDVQKYFNHYEEKFLHIAVNINSAGQFEGAFREFSKRLDDYCITDVNVYLETVQNSVQYNQNNVAVAHCLTMIEAAVRSKKNQVEELIKSINEQFSGSDSDTRGK